MLLAKYLKGIRMVMAVRELCNIYAVYAQVNELKMEKNIKSTWYSFRWFTEYMALFSSYFYSQ